jgi:phosphoglycolate phosphatase
MSTPYRLVVFDWEGTLADTLGQILRAIIYEAKQLNLGEVNLEHARRAITLGPVVALKRLFPHLSAHQHSELLQTAQQTMLMNSDDICITDGALQVLTQLKDEGIQLAVATNKGRQSLQRDLDASGIAAFFDVTRTASEAPAKPCPQMLEEIMTQCNVSATQTLMVGDSTSDMEMAVQLNVHAVGVDLYHQSEFSLRQAGASEVFHSFQDLADYLELSK